MREPERELISGTFESRCDSQHSALCITLPCLSLSMSYPWDSKLVVWKAGILYEYPRTHRRTAERPPLGSVFKLLRTSEHWNCWGLQRNWWETNEPLKADRVGLKGPFTENPIKGNGITVEIMDNFRHISVDCLSQQLEWQRHNSNPRG